MKHLPIIQLIAIIFFCLYSSAFCQDFDILKVYPDAQTVRLVVHETGEDRIFHQGETINDTWTIVKVSEKNLTIVKQRTGEPILQVNIPLDNLKEEKIELY